MSPPANSGIPSRYDLHAKWDACLDLSIHRVAYSSLAGAFGGLILFPLPSGPNARWHDREIPAGFAKVGVDEIMAGFHDMELDIAGPEDERTLGEMILGSDHQL
ncbi:hypothetical protein ZWY2020_009291 [Hordeum vulgare]|nr:hypothetical protein ZWY2020_009291 [Hordeum vulgare]